MDLLIAGVSVALSIILSLTTFAFVYGRDISEIKTKVNLLWDVNVVDKLMYSQNVEARSPFRFRDGFLENLNVNQMPEEILVAMCDIAMNPKIKCEIEIKVSAIKKMGFEYLKLRAIKFNVPMTEYLYYWVMAIREMREIGCDNFLEKVGKNVRNG